MSFVKGLVAFFAVILPSVAVGSNAYNISTTGRFDVSTSNSFVFSASDCSRIVSVQYTNSEGELTDSQLTDQCEYSFSLAEGNQPAITITYIDGTTDTYSESFSQDTISPEIYFESVNIIEENEQQSLVVTYQATDNADISKVGIDLKGITASALRGAGGVVDNALTSAFANSAGYQIIIPKTNAQTSFSLKIPFDRKLSAQQIYADGLLLLNAYVIDAYGNKAVTSSIEKTGGTLEEKVLGWRVFPERVSINDPFQSVTLLPYINFEFRGETVSAGEGLGVTYTSSDPEHVKVSSDGTVYVSPDADSKNATITVNYPSLNSIDVPIEVNFSKKLKGLSFGSETLTIPSLNKAITLPPIEAIYENGDKFRVSQQYAVDIEIPEFASNYLKIENNEITSLLPISSTTPVLLTFYLANDPTIKGEVAVSAIDALPNVDLTTPIEIVKGKQATLVAKPVDDVSVFKVDFLVEGKLAATVTSPPYEFLINISEFQTAPNVKVQARVTDSAGQTGYSAQKSIMVIDEDSIVIPDMTFEKPIQNQRVVAGTRVDFKLSHNLGEAKKSFEKTTGIERVNFYVDGKNVGTASFPGFEVRKIKTPLGEEKDYLFETWSLKYNTQNTTIKQKSVPVYAEFVQGIKTQATPSRFLNLIRNTAASLNLQHPQHETDVIAGGTTTAVLQIMDDTLFLGTDVEILLNGRVVDSHTIFDNDYEEKNELSKPTAILKREIDIDPELLGDIANIQVKVTDFHGEITQSEVIRTNVKSDQGPSVSLSNPVEGDYWIAGLPVELRAAASDDEAVKMVEFYVNDQLIGSDTNAPYSAVFDVPVQNKEVQNFSVYAKAIDSKHQSSNSQVINVAVGVDNEKPVVQFVSPSINGILADSSVAKIVTGTEHLIKVTGYDNVGVSGFKINGVKKQGSKLKVTGVTTDSITDSDIPIQRLPGEANSFSIAGLASFPIFDESKQVEQQPYTLNGYVTDEAGNQTSISLTVAVINDQRPSIYEVELDQLDYTSNSELTLNVIAKDDVGVKNVQVSLIDEKHNVLISRKLSDQRAVTPNTSVQGTFSIDLATLSLANEMQSINLKVIATDTMGQESDVYSNLLSITRDSEGPVINLVNPLASEALLVDKRVVFTFTAFDKAPVESVTAYIDGDKAAEYDAKAARQVMSLYHTPKQTSPVKLEISAVDKFGNVNNVVWDFNVYEDPIPNLVIEHPVTGSSYIEGELVEVLAYITDNSTFSAKWQLFENGKEVDNGTMRSDLGSAQYLASFNMPNVSEEELKLVVSVNDGVQIVTEEIKLRVIQDSNAPIVSVVKPNVAFSLETGQSFEVSAVVTDDIHIDDVTPVFIDSQGKKHTLEWFSFVRKDSIERIEIENPITIGTSIVHEQVKAEVNGIVFVPGSFWGLEAVDYDFTLHAVDGGANQGSSDNVKVTLLPDTQGPNINVISPLPTVIQNELVTLHIDVEDASGLSTIEVKLQDEILHQSQQIDDTFTSKDLGIYVDFSQFNPIPSEGKEVELSIVANDRLNNQSQVKQTIKIEQDKPAKLVLDAASPQPMLIGEHVFVNALISDDYAPKSKPVVAGLVLMSDDLVDSVKLSYQVEKQNEIASGLTYEMDMLTDSGEFSVFVGDKPWLEFEGNKLKALSNELESNAKLVFKTNLSGEFKVKVSPKRADACMAIDQAQVYAFNEEINLLDLEADSLDFEIISEVNEFAYFNKLSITKPAHNRYPLPNNPVRLTDSNYQSSLIFNTEQGRSWVAFSPSYAFGNDKKALNSAINLLVLPPYAHRQDIAVFGVGLDYLRQDNAFHSMPQIGTMLITESTTSLTSEQMSPTQLNGLKAGEKFDWNISFADDAKRLQKIEFFINDQVVASKYPELFSEDFTLLGNVPTSSKVNDDILLSVNLTDSEGVVSSISQYYPVIKNNLPEIDLIKFGAHNIITDKSRLNYGEFWVRNGASFNYDLTLLDDTGLSRLQVERLLPNGSTELVFEKDYATACDQSNTVKENVSVDLVFNHEQTQQYRTTVFDVLNQKAVIEFFVHPLGNVKPGIRIVSPAPSQSIVTGAFNLRARVIVTDDRKIEDSNIVTKFNGVKINYLNGDTDKTLSSVDKLKLAEIYDEYEKLYGEEIAKIYASEDSEYLEVFDFYYKLPEQVTKDQQTIALSSVVTDLDNDFNKDEVVLNVVPDNIEPSAAILYPKVEFGVVEASSVKTQFTGYDNVKVSEFELFKRLTAVKNGQEIAELSYDAPIRTISNIPAKDHNVITTNDIDTPVYDHIFQIDTLANIQSQFPTISDFTDVTFFVWLKLRAVDANGNEYEVENAFKVNIDQRPVVDIVSPNLQSKIVEGAPVSVNIHAQDDVKIEYVRASVFNKDKLIESRRFEKGPYTFSFYAPTQAELNNDTIRIDVEALDSYGQKYNDVDNHLAKESITLPIVADQAPVAEIAFPQNNANYIEGQTVLTQVVASDDVGIDNVSLQVKGLVGGDLTLSDGKYPYEFVFKIPFGQTGKDIELLATVTEHRKENARTSFSNKTKLHVSKDTTAPIISIINPQQGVTVTEQGRLKYAVDATDNVEVSSVNTQLVYDFNNDGVIANSDIISQNFSLIPPYNGEFVLPKLQQLNQHESEAAQLQVRVIASDGAGNTAAESTGILLRANSSPDINNIILLDTRGIALDNQQSVTVGRDFIANVHASDLESGVESVTLYRSVNNDTIESFEEVGLSGTAPFTFEQSSRDLSVGDTIYFRAKAIDTYGKESDFSSAFAFTVMADQPPEVYIVQPSQQQSYAISGEPIDVFVRVKDDLGVFGIDRVRFLMNDKPAAVIYQPEPNSNIFKARLYPPVDAKGINIQAVAFDKLDQQGLSEVIKVGILDDTVEPEVVNLAPLDGEILDTENATISFVTFKDYGSSRERLVKQTWLREYQNDDNQWITLYQVERELIRDDQTLADLGYQVSEPKHNQFVYWTEFSDGNILTSQNLKNERVRVVTSIITGQHTVAQETTHLVAHPISEKVYFSPKSTANALAKTVHYNALAQYRQDGAKQSLVGAWSTVSPVVNLPIFAPYMHAESPEIKNETGLFLADYINGMKPPKMANDLFIRR